MSQLTNYAENKLADFARGQGLTLPIAWYLALASECDDVSFVEVGDLDYSRRAVTRNLTKWAATDGPGQVVVSNGTSHATSNNEDVDWGTAGANWGDVKYVVLCDADSGGNAWMYFELDDVLSISSGDPVLFIATSISFTLGLGGGMTNSLANKLIDRLFRGQAFAWPAVLYVTLYGNDGNELAAPGYARVPINSSLAAWSGTQGSGTTTTSNGSDGRISNNQKIQFAPPLVSWGVIGGAGLADAATLGNHYFEHDLSKPKTASTGAAPSFDPNKFGLTFR